MTDWKRRAYVCLTVFGILLCFLPFLLHLRQDCTRSQILRSASAQMETLSDEQTAKMFEEAEAWNDRLALANGGLGSVPDSAGYESQMNLLDHGIMGFIRIPAIEVSLPIYHGTSQEVLSRGAGHLSQSSLPCGSKTGHCVLSAHRGLPGTDLFTRLDELTSGDVFFLEAGNRKMAYQVETVRICQPSQTGWMQIRADEDLVSLVTCTPYGINSHRLIVTGRRIDQAQAMEQTARKPSWRERIFRLWPFALVFAAALSLSGSVIRRKKKLK